MSDLVICLGCGRGTDVCLCDPMAGFDECEFCGGGGEISDNPTRNNDPQAERTFRCPVCAGNGAVSLAEFPGGYQEAERAYAERMRGQMP